MRWKENGGVSVLCETGVGISFCMEVLGAPNQIAYNGVGSWISLESFVDQIMHMVSFGCNVSGAKGRCVSGYFQHDSCCCSFTQFCPASRTPVSCGASRISSSSARHTENKERAACYYITLCVTPICISIVVFVCVLYV